MSSTKCFLFYFLRKPIVIQIIPQKQTGLKYTRSSTVYNQKTDPVETFSKRKKSRTAQNNQIPI